MTGAARPRVTIVMTARERHSLAEAAIDSVVDETAAPYRFIYLDAQSPGWLRDTLDARAAQWGLEIVRFEEPLWPQEARMRVLPSIDTEYVVFIDNDVQVDAGWLERLVACADETGAGIVGPLYLWGDGVTRPTVHMAGGELRERAEAGGRVLEEGHLEVGADPQDVEASLARRPCDYVEFHCMLVRTDVLRQRPLDVGIRCVHEHIDIALSVREHGLPVFLEPSARVTYLAFADYMLDELDFFRSRWSVAEAESGLDVFCRKWNVLNDDRSFGGVRRFLFDHVREVDPVRVGLSGRGDLCLPMRRDELKQTRSDLLDLAIARGYGRDELALFVNAYHIAHVIVDGGYRPCGRPFITHLVGTASVLVRFSFRAEVVAAGLLHAAYTHAPPHPRGPREAHAQVRAALGSLGNAVHARVRGYTLNGLRAADAGSPASANLSVQEAELIAIEAANELDMHLSGEFDYSGRSDRATAETMEVIAHVCETIGVSGLYESLVIARGTAKPPPAEFLTRLTASYRIGPDRQSAVAMAVNPVDVLAQQDLQGARDDRYLISD